MGAKCYKIGILLILWLITGLFLEVFGKYIPNYHFSRAVEKVGAVLYIALTWGMAEWIYLKIQLKKIEKEHIKVSQGSYNVVQDKQRMSLNPRIFFISYFLIILSMLIYVPLDIWNIEYRFISLMNIKYISLKVLFMQIFFISAMYGLVYTIFRPVEANKIKEERTHE